MVYYWHTPRTAFDLNSAICLVESDDSNSFAFIRESSRYINQLILPNESSEWKFSKKEELFKIYELAFCNHYVGQK